MFKKLRVFFTIVGAVIVLAMIVAVVIGATWAEHTADPNVGHLMFVHGVVAALIAGVIGVVIGFVALLANLWSY